MDKRSSTIGTLVAALAVLAFWALPATAAADEAEQIYQPSAMVEIDLTFSPEAVKSLEEEPGEDVKGAFSAWLTDGSPGGSRTKLAEGHPVEAHLKGHVTGSFRPFTGKAAFKLKFKKDERFLGLRKMTLNNMVEDLSMVHETLTYSLFRAAGVPASRTGFAYLRVNGEDFGVYLDIENLDETSLARLYGAGNTLHLYEGEFGADVDAEGIATLDAPAVEGEPKFEMDEGDPPPTDLEALAGAVAAPSPSFSSRLAGLADLDEMTRMWAVEKYISDWDGYSGETGEFQPNNYYLHSDLSGLFQMLPWGADNTWQLERRIGFDGPGGLLFNGCLGDSECFGRYVAALRALQGQVAVVDPGALATSTAALLRPWQELEEEESERVEYTLPTVEANLDRVHQYVAERPGELAAWLASLPPAPISQAVPNGPQTTLPALRLKLARVVKHRRSLGLHLKVPAAGTLSLHGVLHTSAGKLQVCSDSAHPAASAVVTLRCHLSDEALRHLRMRSLKLTLFTRLRTVDGSAEGLTTTVRLPRLESRG